MNKTAISAAIESLTSRAQGASVAEIMEITGCKRKAAQSAFFRRSVAGKVFHRKGIDEKGFYCYRYFSNKAAAEKYTFARTRANVDRCRINTPRDLYLNKIKEGPITYSELAQAIGINFYRVEKMMPILKKSGEIYTALKISHETKRRAFVLFVSEQERDAWAEINPYQKSKEKKRQRPPRQAKPPKPPKQKQVKQPVTRNNKQIIQRSALVKVNRVDKLLAESLSARRIREFKIKPKPPEYKLTPADLEKRTIYAGHPGYDSRYQLAPNEKISGAFSAMRYGQYMDDAA